MELWKREEEEDGKKSSSSSSNTIVITFYRAWNALCLDTEGQSSVARFWFNSVFFLCWALSGGDTHTHTHTDTIFRARWNVSEIDGNVIAVDSILILKLALFISRSGYCWCQVSLFTRCNQLNTHLIEIWYQNVYWKWSDNVWKPMMMLGNGHTQSFAKYRWIAFEAYSMGALLIVILGILYPNTDYRNHFINI